MHGWGGRSKLLLRNKAQRELGLYKTSETPPSSSEGTQPWFPWLNCSLHSLFTLWLTCMYGQVNKATEIFNTSNLLHSNRWNKAAFCSASFPQAGPPSSLMFGVPQGIRRASSFLLLRASTCISLPSSASDFHHVFQKSVSDSLQLQTGLKLDVFILLGVGDKQIGKLDGPSSFVLLRKNTKDLKISSTQRTENSSFLCP